MRKYTFRLILEKWESSQINMVTRHDSIKDIDKDIWNDFNASKNPFTSYEFFCALEDSNVIGDEAGWSPKYFISQKGATFLFIKSHSYGEYTFDWQWAQAYEQNGLDYYPKITSMSPLSPVTTDHFLGDDFQTLYDATIEFYNNYNLSSIHHLYLNDKNLKSISDNRHLKRINIQYKFFNDKYKNFSDYLSSIKNKKKKQILKERIFRSDIEIKQYTADELTAQMAKTMFIFYKQTVNLKRSIPYLNESYFINIFKNLKKNLLYVEASISDTPIAGSLFFYDENNLYGRYWGASVDVKNLHFELCYYQGLDFCFKHDISIFEAGAQGEHKIKRGFRPIEVNSCHDFKNESFKHAIKNYIAQETAMLQKTITELKKNLPFKSDQE